MMALGVPRNAASMNRRRQRSKQPRRSLPTSTLRLRVHSGEHGRCLDISVDGVSLTSRVALDWSGFEPQHMLGADAPLMIAPVIVGSVDGRTISWIDFRDFVGVFDGPLATWTTDWEGVPWPIPDLHFDSDAYLREIHRVRRQLR